MRALFKELYDKVYESLSKQVSIKSAYVDPSNEEDIIFDPILHIVATVIETNFGINQRIVLDAFQEEMRRRNIEERELVPTFFTRFAMEEGTWVVLLRTEFTSLLQKKAHNILELEERIWRLQQADPEEGIYYLLEMQSLGKSVLQPIFDFWQEDHNTKSNSDILKLSLTSLLNVFSSKALQVLEGSKRILNAKLYDLETSESDANEAEWRKEAIKYANNVHEDLNKKLGEYSVETVSALVLQGFIQSQVRKHKRSVKRPQKTKKTIEVDVKQHLSWEKLPDSLDSEEYEDFQSKVYSLLLSFHGYKPLEAANQVIRELFEEKQYDSEFSQIVKRGAKLKQQDIPYEYQEVMVINEKLPQYLLEKRNQVSDQHNIIKETQLEEYIEEETSTQTIQAQEEDFSELFDQIEMRVLRFQRLKERDNLVTQVKSFIQKHYSDLIQLEKNPIEVANILFEGINVGLTQKFSEEEINVHISNIQRIVDHYSGKVGALRDIDKEVEKLFLDILIEKLLPKPKEPENIDD